MKQFSLAEIMSMDLSFRRTLINSLSGFKSLQMVATKGTNSSANIALFNSIFHIGANPPYLGFVVRPEGAEHETMDNILETKCYTLNNVLSSNFMEAHQTSARYKTGESEFKACGFTEEYIEGFPAPFIKEANVKIGLEFKERLPFTLNNTKIVIGEIKHVIIDERLIGEDGFVDLAMADAVACVGLDAYYIAKPLGRLNYAKPEKQPSFLNV